MFDVVIVPDFAGKRARLFEIRTLLFLSFWLENAGRVRNFPLHIACIGVPPSSVRWLASQCNASITIHQPLDIGSGQTKNKLRGLEISGLTDYILLLDVDVFFLGDPSGLEEIKDCITAAPAIRPRVPERHWFKIYSALEIELPTERIASTINKLGYLIKKPDYPEQNSELGSMLPYYNSGIVFMPWDFGLRLRPLWEKHIYKIAMLFDEKKDDALGGIKNSDMAGFATSIQFLKRQGIPFTPLPDVFHGHWVHLQSGTMRLSDIKLFHATSSFKDVGLETIPVLPNCHIGFGPMWLYRNLWIELSRSKTCLYEASIRRNFPSMVINTCRITFMQQRLYNKYIATALCQLNQ